jgi:dipeptidyl aminopeptidase/acylaminoacyl peptidase
MQFKFITPLCAVLWANLSGAVAPTFSGPTVREVVEFKRILQPQNHDAEAMRSQVSADGTRAFIVTRKSDVAHDVNHYEIQLLHLSAERLARYKVPEPETVFAAAVEQDYSEGKPALDDVRWYDERTLIFRAKLKDSTYQIYRLDLPTRELKQLTRETHPIVSYEAAAKSPRLVYTVQVPNPPMRDGARSIVVGNQSMWSVKYGQQDMGAQVRKYRFYVSEGDLSQPARALGEPFLGVGTLPPRVSISPDGKWALLPRYEPERSREWGRQYPMVQDLLQQFTPALARDPLNYYSRSTVYTARRLVAWRLDSVREQVVVDAPDDALPGRGQARTDVLWQGAGSSLILAGTHLPLQPNARGSKASHVIEYWPETGRWTVVATMVGRVEGANPLSDGFVVIDDGKRRRFRRIGESWQEVPGATDAVPERRSEWSLRVAEGLNQPPDVEATYQGGRPVRLTTLNPQFDANTWGRMQTFSWRDAKGRRWDGGLMSPQGLDPKTRYPLVIQTYGFSPDRFYLDGANIANGYSSGFAGRAFLREGMLVLAMPWRASTGGRADERQEVMKFSEGVRSAIAALVKQGRVDPARIGLMGWSSTGQRVLNAVTFGNFDIRAATLLDGDANTLFSYSVTYGFSDTTWRSKEDINAGLPIGSTRAAWTRNDPSLNTDCIKAAMRIESYGPWVLNNWDIYALLRRQYKAAEMVLIPGGAHGLAQPSERMISLQGNVDWYGYWLTGRKRATPMLMGETAASLNGQYEAWDQMAILKAADDARPRCGRPHAS